MSKFLALFGDPKAARFKRSERLAAKVAQSLGYPCESQGSRHWAVIPPPHCTYPLTLGVIAGDNRLDLVVTAELRIAREWITRELAITLLEVNQQFAVGSFRLMPTTKGHEVLLAQAMDLRFISQVSMLRAICESLLEQFQQTLRRLYATDLILPGPVARDRSTPAR